MLYYIHRLVDNISVFSLVLDRLCTVEKVMQASPLKNHGDEIMRVNPNQNNQLKNTYMLSRAKRNYSGGYFSAALLIYDA